MVAAGLDVKSLRNITNLRCIEQRRQDKKQSNKQSNKQQNEQQINEQLKQQNNDHLEQKLNALVQPDLLKLNENS